MNETTNIEKSKLFVRIGFAFTLMISIALCSNMNSLVWIFTDPSNYQTTNGTILTSTTNFEGTYGGWQFNITYEYHVGNKKYISSRVHYGYQGMADRSYAQGYVEKYPVNDPVIVYYNPSNPKSAVLEPKIKWMFLIYFYSLVFLITITSFGLAIYYKRLPDKQLITFPSHKLT